MTTVVITNTIKLNFSDRKTVVDQDVDDECVHPVKSSGGIGHLLTDLCPKVECRKLKVTKSIPKNDIVRYLKSSNGMLTMDCEDFSYDASGQFKIAKREGAGYVSITLTFPSIKELVRNKQKIYEMDREFNLEDHIMSEQVSITMPIVKKWLKQCDTYLKKNTNSSYYGVKLFTELTKSGRIHYHGVMLLPNDAYVNVLSQNMCVIWSRTSGASLIAMRTYKLYNRKRICEYAINEVTNIESWVKYIQKEYIS